MDIVYDTYTEISLKELERMRRAKLVEPLTYVNIHNDTSIPVQIERFWACSKNKENLQILSRDFYITLSKTYGIKFVLSGYVTDANGVQNCTEVSTGVTTVRYDLNSNTEEADCRMVPHIAKAAENGVERVVVLSNDTDVVMLMVHYMNKFFLLV